MSRVSPTSSRLSSPATPWITSTASVAPLARVPLDGSPTYVSLRRPISFAPCATQRLKANPSKVLSAENEAFAKSSKSTARVDAASQTRPWQRIEILGAKSFARGRRVVSTFSKLFVDAFARSPTEGASHVDARKSPRHAAREIVKRGRSRERRCSIARGAFIARRATLRRATERQLGNDEFQKLQQQTLELGR